MEGSRPPTASEREAIQWRFEQAVRHHKVGELAEAEAGYLGVLEVAPDHVGALHMQMLVAYQAGRLVEAGDLADKALKMNTFESAYGNNLGLVLQALDRKEEAVRCFRRVIEADPGFPDAHFNLGSLLQSMGEADDAVLCYRNAVELCSSFAPAQNNLGMLLAESGCMEEGIAHLLVAVELGPTSAHALNNLGYAYRLQGDLVKARSYCRKALAIEPRLPEALCNLGMCLYASGELDAAIAQLQTVLDSRPGFPEAHVGMAGIMLAQGRILEALHGFRCAAHLHPENPLYWQYVSDTLNLMSDRQITEVCADDRFISDVNQCLVLNTIEARGAGNVASRMLGRSSKIKLLQETIANGNFDKISESIADGNILRDLNNRLILSLLNNSIICHFSLEKLMTFIRKNILQVAVKSYPYPDTFRKEISFIYALARQCHLNEYVWYMSLEEAEWVQVLEKRANEPISIPESDHWLTILLIACYKPIHQSKWDGPLVDTAQSVSDDLASEFLRYQIEEPREELEIRTVLPCLRSIKNPLSLAVQAQYEANPYPRWLNVKRLPPVPFLSLLKLICPAVRHVSFDLPKCPTILIAGCGSGQHAVQSALVHKGGEIVALDVSRASLAYGARMARRFDVPNIQFIQGDILDVASLELQFHIIECVGVLHHMQDPHEGLRLLSDVLHPDGLMLVGLYSETARSLLEATRAWVRLKNYDTSPEGIRSFRRDIMQHSEDDPRKKCTVISDFYSTSGCRDLLFHVHESAFSLPKIKTMLDSLDLEFLGFQTEDLRLLEDYQGCFPDDLTAVSLDNWHCYELEHPNAFIGMYQFWVTKRATRKPRKREGLAG